MDDDGECGSKFIELLVQSRLEMREGGRNARHGVLFLFPTAVIVEVLEATEARLVDELGHDPSPAWGSFRVATFEDEDFLYLWDDALDGIDESRGPPCTQPARRPRPPLGPDGTIQRGCSRGCAPA